jgi:hypothetical protein
MDTQIFSGYNQVDHQFKSQLFLFRLFHLNHPKLTHWRQCRHGKSYSLDWFERYVLEREKQLVAVDCAGWMLNSTDVDIQCLESDHIALHYWPDCSIEPDLFTHVPTYTKPHARLFRYPWYLKYATFDDFIKFLSIWSTHTVYINFDERMIQHNYLKFNLIDLVRKNTSLDVQQLIPNFWVVNR